VALSDIVCVHRYIRQFKWVLLRLIGSQVESKICGKSLRKILKNSGLRMLGEYDKHIPQNLTWLGLEQSGKKIMRASLFYDMTTKLQY